MADLDSEALHGGVACFDRGEYFAAHEVWEERWRGSQDPVERLLLQGLIQVAAGFHKYFTQAKPASAGRLLARGLAKLEGGPDAVGGIDVAGFCGRVRERSEAAARGELTAAEVPRLGRGG